jgi:hypothetical protein
LFPEANKNERDTHITKLQNDLAAANAAQKTPTEENLSKLLFSLSIASEDLTLIKSKNSFDIERMSRLHRQNKVSLTTRIGKDQELELLLKDSQKMKTEILSNFSPFDGLVYRLVLFVNETLCSTVTRILSELQICRSVPVAFNQKYRIQYQSINHHRNIVFAHRKQFLLLGT